MPVEKELDVFFYAYGDKFRRPWMRALIGEPSRRLPDVDFALGGTDFQGDVGRARELGYFPVNLLSRVISSARINLNVARKPHATVRASSTSRLFELAAAGAAIVTNPYEGIEPWFEPGRELIVVSSADEAAETYRELLADPGAAEELGRRARERVLDEHTFAMRARRLLDLARSQAEVRRLMAVETAEQPAPELMERLSHRLAIVPALNEEECVGGVIEEIRAFDPASRSSSSTTARSTAPPRSPRRRGARPPAAVQPRDRRRDADRLPLRAASTATTSPCRSTATASTTPASSRAMLGPCSPTRPTWSSARASPATASSAPRSCAGSGSGSSRGRSRCHHPPEGDRHDLGLPRGEPARDRPLRPRLPARLPGGRVDA